MPRIDIDWLSDHVEVPAGLTAEQLATGAVGTAEDPTNTNTTAPKGDGA